MPLRHPLCREREPPTEKSLLVLFFRKEQDSSFSEEKEAKRLLSALRGLCQGG
jgi:hypothetical protein